MSNDSLDLRFRRPEIKVTFGLIVGVIFGPLVAAVLANCPGNNFLGPDSEYIDPLVFTIVLTIAGMILGTLIGPIVVLIAQALIRFWYGPVPLLSLEWQSPPFIPILEKTESQAIQANRSPTTNDVCIPQQQGGIESRMENPLGELPA